MDVFQLHQPRKPQLPVVASLPHSGTYVPLEIAASFEPEHRSWLRNSDWFLGAVYDFLPELGVTLLEATHSRYVVDLNRDPERKLFGSFFEAVVAERTAQGRPIYTSLPTRRSLEQRLTRYHEPFHRQLQSLLESQLTRHPRVWLLDLHSFIEPIVSDICLGDAKGSTCSSQTTQAFQTAFAQQGFETVVNAPFNGGHLVRRHGASRRVEALQIELRYTSYMDCSGIDRPPMPGPESLRLERAQPRLRSAIEQALRCLTP